MLHRSAARLRESGIVVVRSLQLRGSSSESKSSGGGKGQAGGQDGAGTVEGGHLGGGPLIALGSGGVVGSDTDFGEVAVKSEVGCFGSTGHGLHSGGGGLGVCVAFGDEGANGCGGGFGLLFVFGISGFPFSRVVDDNLAKDDLLVELDLGVVQSLLFLDDFGVDRFLNGIVVSTGS